MVTRRARRAQLQEQTSNQIGLVDVIETAMGLLHSDGVNRITARKVSEKLGVPVSSVTTWARTKDDLLKLVLDNAIATTPLPTGRGTWQQRLMRYGRQTRRSLLNYPGLIDIALAGADTCPAWLTRQEWLMAVLLNAGLPQRNVPSAVDSISAFILMSAFVDEQLASHGGENHWSRLVGMREDLSAEKYPNSVELAPISLSRSGVEKFEFGLRLLVQGIEAEILAG